MKILKILYLVFGAAMLVDFITSFYIQEEVYRVFFWEANVWGYRFYKLTFLVVFATALWEQRNSGKLRNP